MSDDPNKEEWIKAFMFYSGKQWSDPPPTREEAEREWIARHAARLINAGWDADEMYITRGI